MKKKFLNNAIKIIKKQNPSIKKDEIDKIAYGLEAIYLMIFKLIIIAIIAYFLGILKEVILFFTFYGIIRTFASGMHANSSIACFIISSTLFIGGTYASMYLNINLIFKITFSLLCIICLIKYAPADTIKRPLVNAKKRKKWKIISICLGISYTILIIIFHQNAISNYLLVGMMASTIMIHPLTYKLFKMPYKNYLNYNYGLSN